MKYLASVKLYGVDPDGKKNLQYVYNFDQWSREKLAQTLVAVSTEAAEEIKELSRRATEYLLKIKELERTLENKPKRKAPLATEREWRVRGAVYRGD